MIKPYPEVRESEPVSMVIVHGDHADYTGWLLASNPDSGRSLVCFWHEVWFEFKTWWLDDRILEVIEVE